MLLIIRASLIELAFQLDYDDLTYLANMRGLGSQANWIFNTIIFVQFENLSAEYAIRVTKLIRYNPKVLNVFNDSQLALLIRTIVGLYNVDPSDKKRTSYVKVIESALKAMSYGVNNKTAREAADVIVGIIPYDVNDPLHRIVFEYRNLLV